MSKHPYQMSLLELGSSDLPYEVKQEAEYGQLELQDGNLRYSYHGNEWWCVAVNEIRLLGESSNQSWPWGWDWLLDVLVDGEWHLAPMDALGREQLLEELERYWGIEFDLELYRCTDFNSRVLWPADLAGEPVFDYTDPEPESWWQYALRWIGMWPGHNLQTIRIEHLERIGGLHADRAEDEGP